MNIRIITIISDENINSQLIALFDRMNIAVTSAETSTSGLLLVSQQAYDIVIIHTEVEGDYTCEKLFRIISEEQKFPPVIVLSQGSCLDRKCRHIAARINLETETNYIQQIEGIIVEIDKQLTDNDALKITPFSSQLFDSVPIGIYRIDPEGNFIDANRSMVEITGAPSKETLLLDNYFAFFHHPEDRDNWFDIMGRDHDIRGLVTEFECYTGETIWTRDSVRPVYDEDGTIIFYDGALENVTLQKQNEEKLTFLATHDILTGLPNRNFFHDQAALTISQARYNGDLLAFMVFDLDYFNRINETFGTKVGDKLLQESALRVRTQLRKSDLVSRLEADKFLLLISSLRGRRDALSVAEKINHAFKAPYIIDDKEIPMTASIGISFYPEHGEDVSALIKKAEIAVYSVKNTQPGGYQIFSETQQSAPFITRK
ncbi:MAG: sensor domain-containing diguanylate cyclase [Spirochaetia bacterium]|nr:sensor domain-containing diguanylate cyclase [Spirochaetia bacterium]MCF7942133.1 sensor domain-containing diguanylate cyclase [Spirochaetia bacterium]